MTPICRFFGTLLALALWVLPAAGAAEYHVDREADNEVKFISDAPFDDFEGITDKIDGYAVLPSDSLTASISTDSTKVHFEVTLADLDTGIGLRNEDMRDDYLETDKYPYATYTGTVTEISECGRDSCLVRSVGVMAIHGVENDMAIDCVVRPVQAGYRITSEFVVNLKDHKIDIPSFMFLKISEEIVVQLDFTIKNVSGQEK